jgi:hypothetical protein
LKYEHILHPDIGASYSGTNLFVCSFISSQNLRGEKLTIQNVALHGFAELIKAKSHKEYVSILSETINNWSETIGTRNSGRNREELKDWFFNLRRSRVHRKFSKHLSLTSIWTQYFHSIQNFHRYFEARKKEILAHPELENSSNITIVIVRYFRRFRDGTHIFSYGHLIIFWTCGCSRGNNNNGIR